MNQPIFVMPQNSSIVKLTQNEIRDNSNFIVSGGVIPLTSQLQTAVFGVEFNEEMERINLSFEHEEFNLDVGRMMHESVMISGPKGKRLILIGGKVGSTTSKCVFTNSVVGFDLKYVLQPGLRERVKTDKNFRMKHDPDFKDKLEWINLAPMKSQRANFGCSVFNNQVFVYGGIQSQAKGEDEQYPILANPLVELYDPINNCWSDVLIEGAVPLTSFGYSKLSPLGDKIIIVGGSDGGLLID